MEIECQGCLYTLCGFLCLTEDLSEILKFLWRHGCLRKAYFCEKCGRKCAIGDKDLFFRCNRTCVENTQSKTLLHQETANYPSQQTIQLLSSIGQTEVLNSIDRHSQSYTEQKSNMDDHRLLHTHNTDHLLMLDTRNDRSDGLHSSNSQYNTSTHIHLLDSDRGQLLHSNSDTDRNRTQVLSMVNNNRNCNLIQVSSVDDNEHDGDRILTQLGEDGVHSLLRQPCLQVHLTQNTLEDGKLEVEEPPIKVKKDKPPSKKRCNFKVSMKKGTFFEKSKLPLDTVCKFVMFWCCMKNPTQEFLRNELSLATRTVVDWSNCCRDICVHWAKSVSEKIGGDGVIIQVDEVKINESRSHDPDNKYSFWGMEKDKEKGKIFVVPVPACDAWSLLTVINDWVLPGSVVISNCWKSYDCLKEQEFIQQTIVHSKTFVHPQNNVGQHNYECKVDEAGASAGGDLHMPRFGTRRSHHLGDLAEFMFKRRFANHLERIHVFFTQISHVYPLR